MFNSQPGVCPCSKLHTHQVHHMCIWPDLNRQCKSCTFRAKEEVLWKRWWMHGRGQTEAKELETPCVFFCDLLPKAEFFYTSEAAAFWRYLWGLIGKSVEAWTHIWKNNKWQTWVWSWLKKGRCGLPSILFVAWKSPLNFTSKQEGHMVIKTAQACRHTCQ